MTPVLLNIILIMTQSTIVRLLGTAIAYYKLYEIKMLIFDLSMDPSPIPYFPKHFLLLLLVMVFYQQLKCFLVTTRSLKLLQAC